MLIPATAELLERFYGKPPARSMRAWVGMLGDEILGVVGLYHDAGRLVLFSDMKPEARKHRKFIVRSARTMRETIKALGLPVHATADCTVAGSERLLRWIGFDLTPQGVFAWPE